MKGLLNDHLHFTKELIQLSVQKTVPDFQLFGNPLKGEEFFIKWTKKTDSNIDLILPFDGPYFIDHIRLVLSENTDPEAILLYNKGKKEVLYRHIAETGKTLHDREIILDAGVETDEAVIEFVGEFSNVGLCDLGIYGSAPNNDELFPTPASAEFSGGFVSLTQFNSVSYDCEDAKRAADILIEKLTEYANLSPALSAEGAIRFCYDNAIPENGFRLAIMNHRMEICAADLRGFTYASETIIKLLKNKTLPLCRISDQPRMSFRGVHLMIPSRENIPYYKRLIKYILSPMGYNHIILQVSAGMEFDSHPEINKAYVDAVQKGRTGEWPRFPHDCVADGQTISKEEVAGLVAYARRFGIETIPEVQSLGHVQFMTLAHPEIAEIEEKAENKDIDTRGEDARPDIFYHHSYCPSNEQSYQILFDLLDEIIEVFQPKEFVHMGHDEVYQIGLCPRCKKVSPAKLFADDVNRIHQHLAEKGLKMMIWGDMLQPVTKYKTPAAIDRIPKDIVLLDFIWYFHMSKDIEDNLLPKGFKVGFGNMYSSHFPRYESRIVKDGIIGAQVSAWTTTNDEELGREGKIYDFLFSAEMLWSDTYTKYLRLTYDRLIKKIMPALREKLQDKAYPSLTPAATQRVVAENTASYPLTAAPSNTEYVINACFDSIVFEHNTINKITRIPWIELTEAGRYIVEYEDGETLEIPLKYGGNISHWNRRQNEPFAHEYYRHNGYSTTYYVDAEESKTPDGENISVYRYEWINPKKDAAIRRIKLVQNNDCKATVFLHKIIGINA